MKRSTVRTSTPEQGISHSFFPDDTDDSLCDPEDSIYSGRSRRFNRLSSARPNETKEDKQPKKERIEPVKSALDGLSEEDKTKHFNLCIKLATENKLSAENVFSLHLIDYLAELVHSHQDEPNFQRASITLQASAQIYAARVDSLYAQTMKMISYLHCIQRGNKELEEVDDCAEDAGDASNEEFVSDSPKKTMKKRKKKSFICENPASLKTGIKVRKKEQRKITQLTTGVLSRFNTGRDHRMVRCKLYFSARVERKKLVAKPIKFVDIPHDKYQLVSHAIETGSLMSQLPMVGNSLRLSGRYQYLQPKREDPSMGSRMCLSRRMPSLLRSVTSDDVNFPPTLEAISFLDIKWPLDSDSTMPYIYNAYTRKLAEAFDKVSFENLPNYEASNSFSTAFDCMPPTPISECSASSVTDAVVPASSAAVTDFDHDFYDPIPDSAEGSALLENKELDYLPPTPSGISEISIQEVAKCLLKEPTEYSCIDKQMEMQLLGQHILKAKQMSEIQRASEKKKETRVSKIGRRKKDPFRFTFEDVDTPAFQQKFTVGKRTTLSDRALSNWLPEEVDSESDSEFEDYKWWSLFTVASYEFTNEDFDENAFKEKGKHPEDAEDPSPEGDCPDVEDSFDGDVPADKYGIQLVPKPHIVKREIISYAKVAKKIDQELVKSVMWKILRRGGGKIKDDEVPNKMMKPMKFSIAYKYLMQELPPDLASIMSVAIAFTSLLHIASENNLLLEGYTDTHDISVMQKSS